MTYIFAFLALAFGFAAFISYLLSNKQLYNADGSLHINAEEGETFSSIRARATRMKRNQFIFTVFSGIYTAVWLYFSLH